VASFDYFVGNLRCSKCGSISRADLSTNMQTKLSLTPKLTELGVGQRVYADWRDLCAAGYVCITRPLIEDSLVLLDLWECPVCFTPFNWAKIIIEHSIIRVIESVDLTAAIVESANYISEDCRYALDEQVAASSESIVGSLLEYLRRQMNADA